MSFRYIINSFHSKAIIYPWNISSNQGVIPATIAVKNGVFKAGLHPDELEDLAKAGEDGRAIKCSTRDLPLVASNHYRERYVNNTMIDSATTSGCSQWGGKTKRL